MSMKFKDFHPNIKLRIIETLLSGSVFGMIYPFMTIYYSEHLGKMLTAILLFANIVIGIVVSLYGGYVSDRLGRKKPWVFADGIRFFSILTMAFVNGPFVESDKLSALITIAMMFINSICSGFSGPASRAMLIDVSTSENRKSLYSILYWINNLSIAIGALLGGFLFKEYLFELFCLLSFILFISNIILIFFITETYTPKNNRQDDTKKLKGMGDVFQQYRTVLNDSTFILFTLGYLFVVSLEVQLTSYIGIKLNETFPYQTLLSIHNIHVSVDGISILGILRAENTILIVLCTYLVNTLVNKYSDQNVWFVGLILYSVGYIVVSYSDHAWVLIGFMFIASIGELMYIPIHNSYLAELPPENLRSSYLAVSDFVTRGSLLIAYLSIMVSEYLAPLFMSILFIMIAVVGLSLLLRVRQGLEVRKDSSFSM
jgi:DHA1 family multidrug resistance protein B-like MFS transporter